MVLKSDIARLPKHVKKDINLYKYLYYKLYGIGLSESQVIGLMATDSGIGARIAQMQIAVAEKHKKELARIKMELESIRSKYG